MKSKQMGYKDKEKQREYLKKYYERNKLKNLEHKKEVKRLWRLNNKEKISAYNSKYSKEHREEINKREKIKRDSDPVYRMKLNLRKMTRRSIKNFNVKGNSKLLGCSYSKVRDHLTKQFRDGMSWDNYGEWHIDHIIPLASANTEKEVEKLFHYTNLQPLWAEENLIKGNTIWNF